jgi:hypothetical protein
MGKRLNQERQEKLEPLRMLRAKNELEKLGFKIEQRGKTLLTFQYKGSTIQYYPYSGWATGKTIKDGRGLKHLLNQLIK